MVIKPSHVCCFINHPKKHTYYVIGSIGSNVAIVNGDYDTGYPFQAQDISGHVRTPRPEFRPQKPLAEHLARDFTTRHVKLVVSTHPSEK